MKIYKIHNFIAGISLFFGALINTIISVFKIILSSKFSIKFPEAKYGQCAIIGNGPSMKVSLAKHPDSFNNRSLIGVNDFALSDYYTILKPDIYVILDPDYWNFEEDDESNPASAQTFKTLWQKTNWEINLFVPYLARKSKYLTRQANKNPNIRVTYFNYTVFKGFKKLSYLFFKAGLGMPQCQNVIAASIFIALNMRFKEIFLFGADHSWHEKLIVNEDNKLCIKNTHFYENESDVSYRPFYKNELTRELFSMSELFLAWHKVFYGYEVLEQYAKHLNIKIYNSSEVSFIDSFERKKHDNI